MNALAARILGVPAVLMLALSVTGCATGSSERVGTSDDAVQTLMDNARRAAVAIDVHEAGPGDGFPPRRFRAATLEAAGVTLDETVEVTDYAYATKPSTGKFVDLPGEDDYWQFCITDTDGNWLTYGQTTGVQAAGGADAGGASCSFPGEPDESAGFDVRLMAYEFFEASTSFGPNAPGRTWGSHPKATAWVADRLPQGWETSDVDMRGWTGWQYCITAPSREWFYVRGHAVRNYGDRGQCRIDPNMEGSP